MHIAERMLQERKAGKKDGLYRTLQIMLAYHSNKIEGSTCSLDETRLLFDTAMMCAETKNDNDITEMFNHFRAFDMVLDTFQQKLNENYIKGIHGILKHDTEDSAKGYAIGEYKRRRNWIGKTTTSSPEDVPCHMGKLLERYGETSQKTLKDLLDFHVRFETIHPFQDGNGRVGRLLLFKECLCHNIPLFVISSNNKLSYCAHIAACQLGIKGSDEQMLKFVQGEQAAFRELLRTFHSTRDGNGR